MPSDHGMRSLDKQLKAKQYFENAGAYLTGNDGIEVRVEAVREFLDGGSFASIADIGCGNAQVSLPLLHSGNRLTLLDISAAMLRVASERIPEALRNNVVTIESSLDDAELPAEGFDLVISLGLLAHVPDPMRSLHRLSTLVQPGGQLILQNTNSRHPYTWLSHDAAGLIRRLLGREPYRMNRIPEGMLVRFLAERGFQLKNSFHYVISFPLVGRLMPLGSRRRLVGRVFGSPRHKRCQWLGNDALLHFVKER